MKGHFLEGVKDGLTTIWYDNGFKKQEQQHKMGIPTESGKPGIEMENSFVMTIIQTQTTISRTPLTTDFLLPCSLGKDRLTK